MNSTSSSSIKKTDTGSNRSCFYFELVHNNIVNLNLELNITLF